MRFDEAYDLILSSACSMGTEKVPVDNSHGRILAENILADTDMPPFNRSAMDGYACRKSDLQLIRKLRIIEEVPAGIRPQKQVVEGTCTRIMTGAEVPEGADCVVKVEDTNLVSADLVEVLRNGDLSNIRYGGEDLKKGEALIRKGTIIQAHHIGLMAMVGCALPVVFKQPGVGVISTGSELVSLDRVPGIAEIRNSNSPQLLAQLRSIMITGEDYGILRDDKELIRVAVENRIRGRDVLLITGGVSMGDYDFVPVILQELGFKILVHKMRVRPGKPLLFAARKDKFIFGLPGNPVSSFIQFQVIIRPFLLKMMGAAEEPGSVKMRLGEDVNIKAFTLRHFLPVRIQEGLAYPLEYHGSGHLAAYARANGILEIPEGTQTIKKNDLAYVRPI